MASLMYYLCAQKSCTNNYLLWLWIVGGTDQLIHSKISNYQYDDEIAHCKEEVIKENPLSAEERIAIEREAQELRNFIEGLEQEEGAGEAADENARNSANFAQKGATFDKKQLFYNDVKRSTTNKKVGFIFSEQE